MAVTLDLVAGLALGKVVRFIWKQANLPTYQVAGLDVVKTAVGAGLAAASEYYRLGGRFADIVGIAGVGIVMDELAKAAGINPGGRVVIASSPKQVTAPRAVSLAPRTSIVVA